MRQEFVSALQKDQSAFGLDLDQPTIEQLAGYYELILQHNPILHLVAPCSPEEFATRHILESLTLLEFLPQATSFADVGSGGGLPAIPCLIARPDLSGVLIESKEKKCAFLEAAIRQLGIAERAQIVNRQFSEVERPHVDAITCRALDRFIPKLQQLVRWSGDARLLFFGSPELAAEMQKLGLSVEQRLMPMSERRFLFIANR